MEITCGDSAPVVDLQLYQLVDRSMNPWLPFNRVVVLLNCRFQTEMDAMSDLVRLSLSRQEFLHTAVPLFKQRTKEGSLGDNILLVHYNDHLRKLLDVKQISVPL